MMARREHIGLIVLFSICSVLDKVCIFAYTVHKRVWLYKYPIQDVYVCIFVRQHAEIFNVEVHQ